MRYPILPVGAFAAAFLVLIPVFWHWRARNIPTLSLIAWLFILNVAYGVNSLVWSNDVWDKAPLWCDISAKLIIGASIALPACTFCICKYLAMVGGNKTVGLDHRDRGILAVFDLGFCWGIPFTFMALHCVVQGHRYNIVQHIGCQPTTHVSTLGISIVWLPPLLLSIGTFVYAGIALYHFVQMRVVFSSVLQVSNSPMSTNRYMRLIAMSATLVLWGTILTSLAIWANTSRGLRPWVNWEHAHSNWNHTDVYVWILMSPQSRRLVLLFWWATPVSSIIVFAFLGFGEDASTEYRRVGRAIIKLLPSRVLPERNEKFGKETLLGSPFSGSSSSKDLPSYFPNSHVTTPPPTWVTEKTSKLRELNLPLPALTRTKIGSKPRAISTISSSDSLNSRKPLKSAMDSGTAYSIFYSLPTTSYPTSSRSEVTQFSILDDHLTFGQIYGPPTPLSINAPPMNQAFRELPPIQPLRSLDSMMGFSRSKARSSLKSDERRWSVSEKLRPAPLQLGLAEGRLRDCASEMPTVAVAGPRRDTLMSGSVQVTIQRREPHDQV